MKNAAIVTLLVVFLAGCARETVIRTIRQPLLPVSQFEFTRKPYQPFSLAFRLGVINFVDQTGAAQDLRKRIADALTTGLYSTSRFDLYDRGQLRDKSDNELQSIRRTLMVDGILQGAITQVQADNRKIVCDVRVTNRFTEAVMFAKSAEIRFGGKLNIELNRDDITTLAAEIARSFPKLDEREEAKIVSISGQTVTINAGKNRGLKTGMTGLVVARGDLMRDPDSNQVLTNKYYVGHLSVISVEDTIAKARLNEVNTKSDGVGEVRVNDYVIFK